VDRLKRLSSLDWVLVGATITATALMVRTVFIQGIGYDAAFEMEAFLTVSDIPGGSTLTEAYDIAPITSEFYGLLTFQLASLIAALFGTTLSPDTFFSYLVHHLVVAVLALVGASAAGFGVAAALRSRTAGLFTAALIMFTPLWLGMGAMNYKDIPVAAGLSLLSWALILLGGNQAKPVRTWILALTAGSLGAFIALGTRAGAIALVVALIGATAGIRLISGITKGSLKPFARTLTLGASAITVTTLGLIATNPIARINIVQWMQDSISISSNYIWVGLVRTAGQDLPSDQLPWWYAPIWLLAQLPVLTTLAILIGLITLVAVATRGHVKGLSRSDVLQMSPLLIQGWVLPVVVIATGAVLYDGIRHLSFMLPGIIATAAIPIAAFQRQSTTNSSSTSRWQRVVVTVSIIVVAASAFATVRWFPYSYAFINPVAGAQKDPRAWELDYWGLTTREGVTRLRAEGLDPIAVAPAPETGRPFSVVNGEAANAATATTGEPHGVYVFRRWDAVFRQDWCTRTFIIQRDRQTLGEGGTCP